MIQIVFRNLEKSEVAHETVSNFRSRYKEYR